MLGDDEIQSKGNPIIERHRYHDLETVSATTLRS